MEVSHINESCTLRLKTIIIIIIIIIIVIIMLLLLMFLTYVTRSRGSAYGLWQNSGYKTLITVKITKPSARISELC